MPIGIYKHKSNQGFQKGNSIGKSNKGRKNPLISNEKHYKWLGDKVNYRDLHAWVSRKLGKPDTCEHCSISGLSGKHIHWANISGEYKRELNDWIRLCARCHKIYDLYG